MKIKIYLAVIIFIGGCLGGCLDEYAELNNAPRRDGPEIFLEVEPENNVKSTRVNGTEVVYVPFGKTVTFTVNVADAPGLIDSAFVTLDAEGRGTAVVDEESFSAVRGAESGSFKVFYTADDDNTGFVTLSVIVKDAQNVRNEAGFITTPGKETEAATAMLRGIACIPSTNLVGTWTTVASGGDSEDVDGDGGFDYSNLTASVTFAINTTGTSLNGESASVVRVSDASFGLYPYQGFTAPTGRVTFCDNMLTDYTALTNASHAIMMTGQINTDGTLTINWSNKFGDSGTVTLTKQ
jgi:hypothetical protein